MPDPQPPDLDSDDPIMDFPDPAFGESADGSIESPLPGEDAVTPPADISPPQGEAITGSVGSLAPLLPAAQYLQETKPGLKTTEGIFTLAANVFVYLQLIGLDPAAIPNSGNKYLAFGLLLLNGLYAIGRGKAKQGIPYNPGA